jgi:hypothetical protein
MIGSLLNKLFGCNHNRTTFPLTSNRKSAPKRTYVVCLDCGKEFDYNWNAMRVGGQVESLPLPTVHRQHQIAAN